ncbi:MAG TPA: zf-HC2 domain-containing protein [Bacteroidales bacterium]|jgi:anti-sigma factor RsiW|nr:zf-HC2 domain-containing protein [Bacteroidales bacterium]
MNCKRIKQYLIFLADGSLDAELAGKVREHLKQCKQCNHAFREIQEIFDIAGSLEPVKVDSWFTDRVEQEFLSLQNEKSKFKIWYNKRVNYLKMVPVAASLIIALGLGIIIGSELSDKTAANEVVEYPQYIYDNLITDNLYQISFEAYLLNNENE